jgi:hypothetical protein
MKKLRIVILGYGTARQKRSLNDGQLWHRPQVWRLWRRRCSRPRASPRSRDSISRATRWATPGWRASQPRCGVTRPPNGELLPRPVVPYRRVRIQGRGRVRIQVHLLLILKVALLCLIKSHQVALEFKSVAAKSDIPQTLDRAEVGAEGRESTVFGISVTLLSGSKGINTGHTIRLDGGTGEARVCRMAQVRFCRDRFPP